MKTIGIVGNGFVGGATALIGKTVPSINDETKLIIYDQDEDKCSHYDLSLSDLADQCDFIFVCVPTPMNTDGTASTVQVEKVVIELIDSGYDSERIIIRSTVPVGTSRRLGTMFMPEFLTERNWKKDFLNQKKWLLGTNDRNDSIRDELYSIFKSAYENDVLLNPPEIQFMTTEEAELVKYVRNSFLAVKVSFFNEIYDFCTALDIDYDNVRDAVVLDERVGGSHTQVPGPDGKRGFGGTCFPKDMASFLCQLAKIEVYSGRKRPLETSVVAASINRNDLVDRPERDWKKNKGRAVI